MKRPPSFGVTLATILFPVVLMLLKALADVVWDDDETNRVRVVLDFIGEPLVALFLAVLLAMVTFGYAVGFDSKAISRPDRRQPAARSPGSSSSSAPAAGSSRR